MLGLWCNILPPFYPVQGKSSLREIQAAMDRHQ
jgi:hypothetical protein